MEEDIQNYSPTVMFRGTPGTKNKLSRKLVFSFRISSVQDFEFSKIGS